MVFMLGTLTCFLFFLGNFPKKCIIELCGGGGTADTHASGACAPSGVRVQIPFSASWKGGSARYGTGLEIRQRFSSCAGSNPILSFHHSKRHEIHISCLFYYFIPASRSPSAKRAKSSKLRDSPRTEGCRPAA